MKKTALRHAQRITFLGIFWAFAMNSFSQELNCQVQVISNKISGVDQSVFKSLQQAIFGFMNNRVWTTDNFAPEEKIDCSLYILLESNPAQDYYIGSITAQLSRPTFNSSYSSPLLNFRDNSLNFTYQQNMPLDFNINSFTNNLTSILAYYAYLFVALDYESMNKGGGAKWVSNMNIITNQAPTTGDDAAGLSPFSGNAVTANQSRYQVVASLQNSRYDAFMSAMSEYHLQGMDKMYEKPDEARKVILGVLKKMNDTFKDNPNNVLLTMFMQAKVQELINIFSGSSDQSEKQKAVTYLKQLDPTNATKYDNILKGS